MKRFSLFYFLLFFIHFNNCAQSELLSDKNKRELIIKIIDKVNSLNSSINVQRSRTINKKLLVSNDLYWSNKPDTSIDYKRYLELIKSKTLDYDTKIFIENIYEPKLINEFYESEVLVKRIVKQRYKEFNKIDTISQKIVFKSKLDSEYNPRNPQWDVSIQNILNNNNLGRVISLKLNGDKNYFERYGANFRFTVNGINRDSTYIISPSRKFDKVFYYFKDLTSPFKINSKRFSNYFDLYEEFKPKDDSMPRIAELKVKNSGAGRYGYFEFDLGKQIFLKNNFTSNSSLSIDDDQNSMRSQNNWNTSLKYNCYLRSPFRLYFGLGINSSSYTFNANFDEFNQSFDDIDPDGSQYLRNILYNNFQESYNTQFLGFPFSVGLNFELENFLNLKSNRFHNFHLFLDFSYSGSYLSNTLSNSLINSNVQYSGYYSDFFNITISENGVYDFGDFLISNKIDINPVNNWNNTISIGLKNVLNRFIFSLNLNYDWMSNSIFTHNESNYLSTNIENINSYFSLYENTKISTLSINFKLGWILIKVKDEKF